MSIASARIEPLETRVTPAPIFTQLNLFSDLNGENGFKILGTGVAGVNVEISAVANAGDVNGDGFPDLLVGIPGDSTSNRGRAAIIFGHTGGFPLNVDLDSLGSAGVLFTGQVNGDLFGSTVAGVGDVNGDGFDDFVIGAPGNDAGVAASERGAAYVIFGKANLATFGFATLDGTNGFKIAGDTRRTGISGIAQAVGGFNLAGAGRGGDFNNDGFDDVLIGAPDIQAFAAGGASSGAAFIVFGKNTNTGTGGSAFTSPMSVADLTGPNGFMVGSTTGSLFMGSEVGFVGDVNQDGFDDFSLGNMENPQLGSRTSYIIFGRATNGSTPASIILENLAATDGFEGPESTNVNFVGPISYGSEWVLRDIDNDGDQDLGVSFVHQQFLADPIQGYTFVKNSGKGYTTNPFGTLSKEVRQALYGFSNVSVDAHLYDLGDFNGDGFYDIASFPPFDDYFPNVFFGRSPTKTYYANNGTDSKGQSFTGLSLPPNNGRVFFIGDVSGDGIDDALVLPPSANSSVAAAPNAYVVFGSAINPSADGRTVTYRDVDGDTITVKTTKGAFTREMFTMSHPLDGVERGQHLDLLDITSGGQDFSGANITISVKKAATGDGYVNIGTINATGIDLGTVSIRGRLNSIDAGDADFVKPGLNKLDVYHLGRDVSGPAVASSDIVGRIGSIVVRDTFDQATVNVTGAATEGLGSISVTKNFHGTLDLAGPLGSFKAFDVLTGSNIDADGPSTKKTAFTAHLLGDGVTIDLATTISKLSAKQIGAATIEAARLDTLSVTGDTKAALPGSLAATIRAPGGVGTVSVKENFSGNLDLASGPLNSFKAYDLTNSATIKALGVNTKKTSITAHVINDGVTIDIANTLSKLSAAKIGDATITADRIDSLSVNGDSRNAIVGDLTANITLDNAGVTDGKTKALGTVKIAGTFHDAKIIAAGSVGSFSAAAMHTASLFAGYTPATPATPLTGGTFVTDALIGTFTITGKATLTNGSTGSMDDSFVIATNLGTVSLPTIDTTTGALTWGFAYRDTIKKLTVKTPVFTYNIATGGTQTADDFQVVKLV